MKKEIYPLLLGLSLAAAFLATAAPVRATLGEAADSVTADQKILSAGQADTEVRNGYTVREFHSDAVTLREYIAPDGIVFAIAWNGLIHPDLKPLLGSYADDYVTALKKAAPEPGRRQLQVKTNRVVVEKWGQMRNLQGRAYAPALIPPGVQVHEIE